MKTHCSVICLIAGVANSNLKIKRCELNRTLYAAMLATLGVLTVNDSLSYQSQMKQAIISVHGVAVFPFLIMLPCWSYPYA